MTRFGYLTVEGPHDTEFFCKLLATTFGFSRIQYKTNLNSELHALIPTIFPHQDDLLKRMPVPTFIQNDTHIIAISSAIGDTKLAENFCDSLSLIGNILCGAAIIMDADSTDSPNERFKSLNTKISSLTQTYNMERPLPLLGSIEKINNINMGVFVLPDNTNNGTLENILLECASVNYPDILQNAEEYICKTAPMICHATSKDFHKPAGQNKAKIGTIANILKPCKSVQVSIQDNNWINQNSIDQITALSNIKLFLKDLFDL